MGKKVDKAEMRGKDDWAYHFYCPGCKCHHAIWVEKPNHLGAQWTFNGDLEKPTFSPSLLIRYRASKQVCHSFVRNGKIQFLNDCTHEFAGKTVEMEDIQEKAQNET